MAKKRIPGKTPAFRTLATIGFASMSGMLHELVAPYRELAKTKDDYSKLIGMSCLGWNVSLEPEELREGKLKGVIPDFLPLADQKKMYELALFFCQRKLTLFPEDRRLIVKYEIEDRGDEWHLEVLAAVPPKK